MWAILCASSDAIGAGDEGIDAGGREKNRCGSEGGPGRDWDTRAVRILQTGQVGSLFMQVNTFLLLPVTMPEDQIQNAAMASLWRKFFA